MVAVEIPRDVHRRVKVAAVTEGIQMREWLAEAARQRLEREATQAPKKADRIGSAVDIDAMPNLAREGE